MIVAQVTVLVLYKYWYNTLHSIKKMQIQSRTNFSRAKSIIVSVYPEYVRTDIHMHVYEMK